MNDEASSGYDGRDETKCDMKSETHVIKLKPIDDNIIVFVCLGESFMHC